MQKGWKNLPRMCYTGHSEIQLFKRDNGCIKISYSISAASWWISTLTSIRRMQTLVEQLKQHGYCVYYLSNIPEDVLALLMERDFKGLFDGGVASCEVKINKPDPRIYQALLDKYQLKADECIFIDDRADNIKAASLLGLGTYQMHSVGSLLRSLPTFGVTIH